MKAFLEVKVLFDKKNVEVLFERKNVEVLFKRVLDCPMLRFTKSSVFPGYHPVFRARLQVPVDPVMRKPCDVTVVWLLFLHSPGELG